MDFKIVGRLFILFLITGLCYGQDRKGLENKVVKIRQEIEDITRILDESERRKFETISDIQLLNRKINLQNEIIKNLEGDIILLESSINQYEKMIEQLDKDLEGIKEKYKAAVKRFFFIRKKYMVVMYIIASESMEKAQLRQVFYKRYLAEINKKGEAIKMLMSEIDEKKRILAEILENKKSIMEKKEREKKNLERMIRKKQEMVKNLLKEQINLKKKVEENKRIAKRLEEEIRRIIKNEIKKGKSKKVIELTPEEKIIAGNFEKNKGKLPWPVIKGFIISPFGDQNHPVIKNIKIRNNGIDILTEKNSIVKCIFDGTVTKVVSIIGAKFTVIVRHGNFLSVYQNLDEVYVKAGQEVKVKEELGMIKDSELEDKYVLHFEIWKEFDRLNPEEWIAGRGQ